MQNSTVSNKSTPKKRHDSDLRQKFIRQKSRRDILSSLAADYGGIYKARDAADETNPFIRAQPKLLSEPHVFTHAEVKARTLIACDKITKKISNARSGVLVVAAQDSSYSSTMKSLLMSASEEGSGAKDGDDDIISLGMDWIQCIPSTTSKSDKNDAGRPFSALRPPDRSGEEQLLICVGTTSKYSSMCLGDPIMTEMDDAFESNNLVVITRSAIMLPIGSQEQNMFGVDCDEVMSAVTQALSDRALKKNRPLKWGHGVGTKDRMLSWAFSHLPDADSNLPHLAAPAHPPLPSRPLVEIDDTEEPNTFDHVAAYIAFQNDIKCSIPELPVVNYYDSGLSASVAQKYAINQGVSLLMDRDGLAMNRDASIGHTLSKMNQLVAVEPYRSSRGVYNFFVGDGAMRLNGGAELALYLMGRRQNSSTTQSNGLASRMENGQRKNGSGRTPKNEESNARNKIHKDGSSMVTLFVFINETWAIEDNIIQESVEVHKLYNRSYYELLSAHPNVHMCHGEAELRKELCRLTSKQLQYVRDEHQAGEINVVLITDMGLSMPPSMFPNDGVMISPEVKYLRATLSAFSDGCDMPVPIYGCSAYEYLQFLHAFLGTQEGSRYDFITGMTDIQASHLCGFDHPEGRSVLFMNDIFGLNSLGETLRMNQSGIGDNYRQLIIFVWHPSVASTIDHFQPHRPPCIWPNMSPMFTKFFVLKEKDACFVDFDGTLSTVDTVKEAIAARTPLILINMLPEQERNHAQLDIHTRV